jgi:hypothetical protein
VCIYEIASPLARGCGQLSETRATRAARKSTACLQSREARGAQAPAAGARRGTGPKRIGNPASKFDRALVQVHCPNKNGMGLSRRSRVVSRLSRSQESASAPPFLSVSLSVCLSHSLFLSFSLRWRVLTSSGRSVRSFAENKLPLRAVVLSRGLAATTCL